MAKLERDLGFGLKFRKKPKRIVNKDGSFNVVRHGTFSGPRDVYQYLLNIPWSIFLLFVIATCVLINVLFAVGYWGIGFEHLNGMEEMYHEDHFFHALFFSFQTFTTVGYGAISPTGIAANLLASLESIVGLLFFALATGMLYGRFSKPSAKVLFSNEAIIAPFKEGTSFQFRVVNQRKSTLVEPEIQVVLTTMERNGDSFSRKSYSLNLEVNKIIFFPLSWTVVHPIDDESPLKDLTIKDLEERNAEFLILFKGFDESFGSVVNRRYSYLYNEVIEDAKFIRAFRTDSNGDTVMRVQDIHLWEKIDK